MNFNKLLPNASKNKGEDACSLIVYIATTKWGWSYDEFLRTPIPVILNNLKEQQKEIKEQSKKK